MKYTQMPADAFESIQLNAGILVRDFDPKTGTVKNSDIIGATSGGTQFTATPTYTDYGEDIDNCPTNTMELKRLDSIEAKLSGTYVSATAAQVKDLVGAADIDVNDPTHIVPRNDLKTSDFQGVWWVGDYGTDGGFLALHLMNGLNTGGLSVQSTNKGKGQFAFEITGHYSMADTDKVPYEVFITKKAPETVIEVPANVEDDHSADTKNTGSESTGQTEQSEAQPAKAQAKKH